MAEVPVTINGVICDLYGRTIMGPVKIVGSLMKSGVGVGGGPIMPPESGGGGEGIWGGGNVPMPTPPIANVPGAPGYDPGHPAHPIVLPGDPSWPGGGDAHPEHPIVLPPPNLPTEPPPAGVKPPPPGGGWGYHSDYGWGYFPGTGAVPSPKS